MFGPTWMRWLGAEEVDEIQVSLRMLLNTAADRTQYKRPFLDLTSKRSLMQTLTNASVPCQITLAPKFSIFHAHSEISPR